MKEKCLIFGGGGFIGSHLAEKLLTLGFGVKIFDVKNFSRRNIEEFENNLEIFEGDFKNPIDVANALVGVHYVYHLVSTTIPSNSVLNPIYDVESNLIPTIQLLQLCTKLDVKKIIFISSGGTIYGVPEKVPIPESHPSNPISSYGITKRTIESYFVLYNKLFGLNTCVLRLSNPYGERQNPHNVQGVISVFSYKSIKGLPIEIWGDGNVIRDYIYIEDVVEVLVRALKTDTPEIIYNLGSGVGTSLNKIIETIRDNFNSHLVVEYLEGRNFDVPSNVLDICLLKKRFAWEPSQDLKEGIGLIYNNLLRLESKC